MEESQGQENTAKELQGDGLLHINISFELQTGKIDISGHIDNTDLCTKILVEAAHVLLVRNMEKDKIRLTEQAKTLEIIGNGIKQNGKAN